MSQDNFIEMNTRKEKKRQRPYSPALSRSKRHSAWEIIAKMDNCTIREAKEKQRKRLEKIIGR